MYVDISINVQKRSKIKNKLKKMSKEIYKVIFPMTHVDFIFSVHIHVSVISMDGFGK